MKNRKTIHEQIANDKKQQENVEMQSKPEPNTIYTPIEKCEDTKNCNNINS